MNARDLMDASRKEWVGNSEMSPTRVIIYTPTLTGIPYEPLNAFIGGGNFTVEEKETLENWEVFGGLVLPEDPEVNDTVAYNGQTWKVKRWTRMGELFAVYGYQKRHTGRPRY